MGNRKLPTGLYLRGDTLWIRFSYRGVRCFESTKIKKPTRQQIKYIESKLHEIKRKIYENTFRYEDYFPESKNTHLFTKPTSASTATLKYYIEKDLELARKRGLEETTLIGRKEALNKISKELPPLIKDLNKTRLIEYLTNQSNLSEGVIKMRFLLIKGLLELAVFDGVLSSNIADAIPIKHFVRNKQKVDADLKHENVKPFLPDEIERILAACKSKQLKNLIIFLLETGVRTSEALALTWECVQGDQVKIVRAKVKSVLKRPKTTSSRRTIILSPKAKAALDSQRDRTELLDNSDPVFYGKISKKMISYQMLYSQWRDLLAKAEVAYRGIYTTRHTYATKLISQGVNVWKISKILGHRSPNMLYTHYGYYLEQYEQKSHKEETDPED